MYSSKTILCMQILNIPNDCSANEDHSHLFWASCELLLVSWGLNVSICVRVCISHAFVYALESWFRTVPTREKSFCKTWFQVGMDLKKVQKQVMEWKNTRGLFSIYCVVFVDAGYLSCVFFILSLVSVRFSGPSLLYGRDENARRVPYYRNMEDKKGKNATLHPLHIRLIQWTVARNRSRVAFLLSISALFLE